MGNLRGEKSSIEDFRQRRICREIFSPAAISTSKTPQLRPLSDCEGFSSFLNQLLVAFMYRWHACIPPKIFEDATVPLTTF